MKPRNSLVYILAVLTTLPLVGTVAPAATIEVLQTFDFPAEVTATLQLTISEERFIVGTLIEFTCVDKVFF
jgi:hypothetical protein